MAAPINDNFSDAINLTGSLPISTSGSNVDATKESGEPNHAGNAGGKSVWWKYTPSTSGYYIIKTESSSFDTILGIYKGTAVNELTLIDSDDDDGVGSTSLIHTYLLSGIEYKIAVDGYDGASGSITLAILEGFTLTGEGEWDFDTVWHTNCDDYPDFVGSQCICPYVSNGQVRKMVTTISGLDHLEGETVKVQMDGILPTDEEGELVDNSFTVEDGEITLPKKAAVVHVGLGYEGTIQLLKSNDGSQIGVAQAKMRRVYNAILRLNRSLGIKVGLDEDNLSNIIFNDDGTLTPTLPLFTGDIEKLPITRWTKDAELILKQEDPLPCFILAVILESEVEDK